jgi:hypothetical protein
MIIDLILDRKDDEQEGYDFYNAHDFYMGCMGYNKVFSHIADGITEAMDYGENEDVQRALCKYIDENNYNPAIKDFINSVNWL